MTNTDAINRADALKTMKSLRLLARFMDNGWGIPFTRFRFGADVLTSFVPVGGDMVMVAVSLYLVFKASELGAPRSLLVKMLGNVAVEAGLGAVPVIGGILDVVFRANIRNVELLAEYLRSNGYAVD